MGACYEILLTLTGIIIGAVLQYFFSKRSEARKHLLTMRTDAYIDFLRSNAGVSMSQRYNDSESEKNNLILLLSSKSRISVYGSKKVNELLADFFHNGALLDSPENKKRYLDIVQQMRNESLKGKEKVRDEELFDLLFT